MSVTPLRGVCIVRVEHDGHRLGFTVLTVPDVLRDHTDVQYETDLATTVVAVRRFLMMFALGSHHRETPGPDE